MSKYPHLPGCKCGNYERSLEKGEAHWINAPDYSNCVYNYLAYNPRPHTLSEIADFLDLSISAITAIERKALQKVRKRTKNLKYVRRK